MGDRNLFMELRPVSKDRCSHTSLSLTISIPPKYAVSQV